MSTFEEFEDHGSDEEDFGPPMDNVDYFRSYSFSFEHPQWGISLLCQSVCLLIPMVGSIVLTGYHFEVIEALHRRRGRGYPEFDFNNFALYLTRGIWPFLVQLIASVVLLPIIIVLSYGGMIGAFFVAAPGAGDNPVAAILIGVVIFVLVFVISWGAALILIPMTLRAGLAQDFSMAFDMRFVKDFISKVWVDIILKSLFLWITSMFVAVIGMAVFCVGVYAASAIIMLAQAHLTFQLYQQYLARGGIPIPLKDPESRP